jgi:transposase InsO family protein
MNENQTEKKVKRLHTDNGMEFCSNEFKAYCKSQGIVRHYTIPYAPQQNGVAKRWNRTIISKARCMLSNSGLNRQFWVETASNACYLINHSPCITLGKKTPIEVWSGSLADYSQLRVFGCTAYAHVDNRNWSLELLNAYFLVINLVLKVINCGILQLGRLCLVGILSSMNLLCFMITYLLMLLLRERK